MKQSSWYVLMMVVAIVGTIVTEGFYSIACAFCAGNYLAHAAEEKRNER